MNEKLLIQLCEIILATASVAGIAFILAATWYDLRMIHYRKYLQALSKSLTGRREPSITVLVYAHNVATTLEACLDSIVASRYKNFSIIVADNYSTDDTKKLLGRYKQAHPDAPLLIYRPRATTERPTCLRQAYKKSKASRLVLILDGTDVIPATLMQEGTTRFAANDKLDTLRLRQFLTNDTSFTSLSKYFYLLSRNIIDKSFARSSLSTSSLSQPGMILKSSAFEQKNTIGKIHTDYASTLTYSKSSPIPSLFSVSHTKPTNTYQWRRILSLLGVAVSLALIISIVTYFYYTAATLQSNILSTLSWSIVSLWLLAIIWLDEVYKLRKKIELTFTVPFMYFVFYIQSIIAFIATLRMIVLLVPTPSLSLDKIRDTIRLELYSTHY